MHQVSDNFILKRSTFYSAVYLLDKYISKIDPKESDSLELIAITSLYIFSKKEEISPIYLKNIQ